MSWADENTDMERLIEILNYLVISINAGATAGSSGPDAAAWAAYTASMTSLNVVPKISALTITENIRRIKVKKILQDVEGFLQKITEIK